MKLINTVSSVILGLSTLSHASYYYELNPTGIPSARAKVHQPLIISRIGFLTSNAALPVGVMASSIGFGIKSEVDNTPYPEYYSGIYSSKFINHPPQFLLSVLNMGDPNCASNSRFPHTLLHVKAQTGLVEEIQSTEKSVGFDAQKWQYLKYMPQLNDGDRIILLYTKKIEQRLLINDMLNKNIQELLLSLQDDQGKRGITALAIEVSFLRDQRDKCDYGFDGKKTLAYQLTRQRWSHQQRNIIKKIYSFSEFSTFANSVYRSLWHTSSDYLSEIPEQFSFHVAGLPELPEAEFITVYKGANFDVGVSKMHIIVDDSRHQEDQEWENAWRNLLKLEIIRGGWLRVSQFSNLMLKVQVTMTDSPTLVYFKEQNASTLPIEKVDRIIITSGKTESDYNIADPANEDEFVTAIYDRLTMIIKIGRL